MLNSNTIVIPHRISRAFVIERRDLIFVYGIDSLRKGGMGQAWSCHNEPNTFGIPTCIKYCSSAILFHDNSGDTHNRELVDKALAAIPHDGRPIIVLRKIGEGCSRMKELAPKLFAYMQSELDKISYKNVKVDYA